MRFPLSKAGELEATPSLVVESPKKALVTEPSKGGALLPLVKVEASKGGAPGAALVRDFALFRLRSCQA